MSEFVPHIDNSAHVMDLLSKQDKPLAPAEFESIVSMLPGYPYPPEYLQETLRMFSIDKVSSPTSLNPPIYWHLAELYSGNEDDDALRFALAVGDSYQVSAQGRFLLKQPMIRTIRIGVERWWDRNHSVQVYLYYFLTVN